VRIATYSRISTDEEHQPYSLEAQAQRLAAYVQSQEGWRLVRRFSDQASGATLDRAGLQRALREAQAKRFDLLLVYRVDRLSRSVRGLAQVLEQLDQAGVAFRSASEPFDTSSSAGRMMVQMLGVFAEFERATIVERVIAGMERKAARGEWTGGSRPFGYRLDAGRRHLEPDETEAPLVREIFEGYAERLQGSAALAKWLSERGYRTKKDRPFNPQAVLTILRNRAYLGEITYRGTSYPAPHEPLVDAGLFERAQAILRERGEDASLRRSNTSDYLLTGLLKCVRCGKRYIGACAHGNGGRYPYYVCFSRQRYGKKTCEADSLPAEELEQAVLDQLVNVLEQEPLLREAIDQAFADLDAARPKREAELKRIDAELRKLHETLDHYFRAFEQQTMPEQLCGRRIWELTKKLSQLEARREELAVDVDDPEPLSDQDLAALQAHVRQVIEAGEPAQQKALLQALVDEIRVVSRTEIYPFFSLPAIRPPCGSVPPRGVEPLRTGSKPAALPAELRRQEGRLPAPERSASIAP
jgi:site-specific DNA recombinase